MLVNRSYSVIRNHTGDQDRTTQNYGFIIVYRARHMSDVRIAEPLCVFQEKQEVKINEPRVKKHTAN